MSNNLQDTARILSRLEVKGVATESTGVADGYKFIKTNADGKLDTSLYDAGLTNHLVDNSKHLTSLQNTWLDAITATAVELNYVVGVTSAVQGQLDTLTTNLGTQSTNLTTHSGDATKHLTSQQNTWLDSIESTNTLPAWNASLLTTLNASNLDSGTVPDARFPATLPALSGTNLTALNASNLASGTLPDARFPATLPALSGVNLTALNASNLSSGTLPDARFPATLPTSSGANLTSLNASNLAAGTIPDARFPATLPASSGVNLTALSASNISSGSLAIARLDNYPTNVDLILKGDGTWDYINHGVTTEASSRTLALTHSNGIVRSTGAGSTFTIPTNAAVPFKIGTTIKVINEAATGTMTITPDSGVTTNSIGSLTTVTSRYGEVTLKKLSTNLWHLSGNLS